MLLFHVYGNNTMDHYRAKVLHNIKGSKFNLSIFPINDYKDTFALYKVEFEDIAEHLQRQSNLRAPHTSTSLMHGIVPLFIVVWFMFV
jgi:hypothetical protein